MNTPAALPILALDVDQVAEVLKCKPDTVRERATDLGGIKLGRDWVFPVGALSTRLEAMALEAQPAKGKRQPTAVLHAVPARKEERRPPALPGQA
jgi:hypothetical protein